MSSRVCHIITREECEHLDRDPPPSHRNNLDLHILNALQDEKDNPGLITGRDHSLEVLKHEHAPLRE